MSSVPNKELINDNHDTQTKSFQEVGEETIPKKSKKKPLPSDPSEDSVDPRVQVELEKLNTATDLINKLEIELDDARANFRLLLTESSQRINQMATKLGTCIDRGRPYYEARMKAKELQQETQKAAFKFERASSAHAAAKEMVRLSEEGLCKEGRTFDPTWQEMLNHATMKVNEAEHERRISKATHQRVSQAYNAAEQNVQQLHVVLKRSIVKSSLSTRRSLLQLNNLANQHELQLLPYFEMKAQFNQLLEEQKRKVHSLEENVLRIKMGYSEALHSLEKISDEIHTRRKLRDQALVGDGSSKVNSPALSHKLEKTSIKECYLSEERTDGVGSEDPAPPPLPSLQQTKCNGDAPVEDIKLNSNKSFSLPLQKVSLAQMEEMTPMTPGMLFSPLHDQHNIASKSLTNGTTPEEKRYGIYGWQFDRLVFEVPKLADLAKSVAEVYSVGAINAEKLKDALGKELIDENHAISLNQRAPSPGGLLGGSSGCCTPLRNPNCDPLKMNYREELLSDTESLASTDTADTLDDHHIECLLLDRVLEQDYQDILASTADFVSTP